MTNKPPQGFVAVKAHICVEQLAEQGHVLLGTFDVAELQLQGAQLVLNLPANRLEMRARCGCFVEVPFTKLLQDVARMSADHAPVLQ